MTIKVGINGFGSIGRRFFRIARRNPDIQVVAVNDLTDPKTLAALLKHDSTYGTLDAKVEATADSIVVDGRPIKVTAERDPAAIKWKDLGVQIVIESTGRFTEKEKAVVHITSGGAKKVIISAPAKGEDATIVMGVNDDKYDPKNHNVISNASCTTNCLAPVTKVVAESFGLVKGMMNTVHAYTNDQVILDFPHKDLRRARAAAQNIIPTTTGAAKAVSLVLPETKGKLNGFSLRVPVPAVSVVDLVAVLPRKVTEQEVIEAFKKAAAGPLGKFLGVSEEPLVSSDYKGCDKSATVDLLSTMVVDGDLLRVVAWYDNEWGYSTRLVDLVELMASKGL
ncbi:MAG: type I glyceraldehyde-3-phosphate dehydrogenase [Bacillota bacterium]